MISTEGVDSARAAGVPEEIEVAGTGSEEPVPACRKLAALQDESGSADVNLDLH